MVLNESVFYTRLAHLRMTAHTLHVKAQSHKDDPVIVVSTLMILKTLEAEETFLLAILSKFRQADTGQLALCRNAQYN